MVLFFAWVERIQELSLDDCRSFVFLPPPPENIADLRLFKWRLCRTWQIIITEVIKLSETSQVISFNINKRARVSEWGLALDQMQLMISRFRFRGQVHDQDPCALSDAGLPSHPNDTRVLRDQLLSCQQSPDRVIPFAFDAVRGLWFSGFSPVSTLKALHVWERLMRRSVVFLPHRAEWHVSSKCVTNGLASLVTAVVQLQVTAGTNQPNVASR